MLEVLIHVPITPLNAHIASLIHSTDGASTQITNQMEVNGWHLFATALTCTHSGLRRHNHDGGDLTTIIRHDYGELNGENTKLKAQNEPTHPPHTSHS